MKKLLLLLILGAGSIFAQCSSLAFNPVTGQLNCISAAGGTNVVHTTFASATSVNITVTGKSDRVASIECWDTGTGKAFVPANKTIVDADTVSADWVGAKTGYCNTDVSGGSGGGVGTVTNIAITGDGVVLNSVVTGSPITSTGTLALSLNTQLANRFFLGPASGGAATPTFRVMVSADLGAGTLNPVFNTVVGQPSTDAAAMIFRRNSSGQTSLMVEGQTEANAHIWGISKTGAFDGTAANITGIAAVANGGTNKASWTLYAIPYASGTTTIAEIAIGTAGQCLKVNGTTNGYTWGSCGTGGGSGDATSLQGVNISATAPTTGQALTYNGSVWIPTTLAGTGTVTATPGVLTLNQIIIGNGGTDIKVGTKTGNTTIFLTKDANSMTTGHVYVADASGNATDGGAITNRICSTSATTTVVTFAANATSGSPCKLGGPDNPVLFSAPVTFTITGSGTGTARLSMNPITNNIVATLDTIALSGCTGTCASQTGTAFPTDQIALAKIDAVSGGWSAPVEYLVEGTTGQRSSYGRGLGDTITSGVHNVIVDTTLHPEFARLSKTSNYTIIPGDNYLYGATAGGTFTLTLPTAVGWIGGLVITKTDSSANALVVAAAGAELVNDGASLSLTSVDTRYCSSNNVSWYCTASTGGSGTPGGSSNSVQINNSGSFAGVTLNATATVKYLKQVSSGTPVFAQPALTELSDFPSQTSNADKLLKTNGTSTSWSPAPTWYPFAVGNCYGSSGTAQSSNISNSSVNPPNSYDCGGASQALGNSLTVAMIAGVTSQIFYATVVPPNYVAGSNINVRLHWVTSSGTPADTIVTDVATSCPTYGAATAEGFFNTSTYNATTSLTINPTTTAFGAQTSEYTNVAMTNCVASRGMFLRIRRTGGTSTGSYIIWGGDIGFATTVASVN
jgi:hypothetical protein